MSEKKRRAHDSEASRRALMDAGAALFARHGFAGTTLDMIAARAPANKALVAYHFGSKDGLYQAILDEAVERVLDRVSGAANIAGSVSDRLHAHIRALALALADAPGLCAMLVTEYATGGQQDRPGPMASLVRIYQTTDALVREGIEDGVFRPVDSQVVHLSFTGSFIFFVLTAGYRQRMDAEGRWPFSRPETEAFADFVADGVIRSVSA